MKCEVCGADRLNDTQWCSSCVRWLRARVAELGENYQTALTAWNAEIDARQKAEARVDELEAACSALAEISAKDVAKLPWDAVKAITRAANLAIQGAAAAAGQHEERVHPYRTAAPMSPSVEGWVCPHACGNPREEHATIDAIGGILRIECPRPRPSEALADRVEVSRPCLDRFLESMNAHLDPSGAFHMTRREIRNANYWLGRLQESRVSVPRTNDGLPKLLQRAGHLDGLRVASGEDRAGEHWYLRGPLRDTAEEAKGDLRSLLGTTPTGSKTDG